MSEKQAKPSTLGKQLKLFFVIFLILLVPVVMDQAEVDRETLRMVGRVAAGLTILLFFYGLFTKMLKTFAFVVIILIAAVVLMTEGQVKAPRVKDWLASRDSSTK